MSSRRGELIIFFLSMFGRPKFLGLRIHPRVGSHFEVIIHHFQIFDGFGSGKDFCSVNSFGRNIQSCTSCRFDFWNSDILVGLTNDATVKFRISKWKAGNGNRNKVLWYWVLHNFHMQDSNFAERWSKRPKQPVFQIVMKTNNKY